MRPWRRDVPRFHHNVFSRTFVFVLTGDAAVTGDATGWLTIVVNAEQISLVLLLEKSQDFVLLIKEDLMPVVARNRLYLITVV